MAQAFCVRSWLSASICLLSLVFSMSSGTRLRWLALEVWQGRSAHVSFSYNQENCREKIKFCLGSTYSSAGIYRPAVLAAISGVELALQSSIVTDRGHTSKTTGCTTIEFWIKQCQHIVATEDKDTSPESRKARRMSVDEHGELGTTLLGVGEEAFAGTASTSAPQASATCPDSVLDATALHGTPDFRCEEDPMDDVGPLVLSAGGEEDVTSIDKDDRRYGTWAGLRLVIGNLDAFKEAIEQLGANPSASSASLHAAKVQCEALLGIARDQMNEILRTDLAHCSKEDAFKEMERFCVISERLMTRSDKIRELLVGIAKGEDVPAVSCNEIGTHGSSSASTSPSIASISATQRLMAPKSGKPNSKTNKHKKHSQHSALSKNSDGKYVRR